MKNLFEILILCSVLSLGGVSLPLPRGGDLNLLNCDLVNPHGEAVCRILDAPAFQADKIRHEGECLRFAADRFRAELVWYTRSHSAGGRFSLFLRYGIPEGHAIRWVFQLPEGMTAAAGDPSLIRLHTQNGQTWILQGILTTGDFSAPAPFEIRRDRLMVTSLYRPWRNNRLKLSMKALPAP